MAEATDDQRSAEAGAEIEVGGDDVDGVAGLKNRESELRGIVH